MGGLKCCVLGLAVLAGTGSGAFADYSFIKLHYPTAFATGANGVSGDVVLGGYSDGGTNHGYLYDTTMAATDSAAYTRLMNPLESPGTFVQGIAGDTVVGLYNPASGTFRGFIETGGTWTPFDKPNATSTVPAGVSASAVVGGYIESGVSHGFIFDRTKAITDPTAYISIDVPGANIGTTGAKAIYGNTVVGNFTDALGKHGFIFDSSKSASDPTAYTVLTDPLGTTTATGVSGTKVVGYYQDATNYYHGFIYNMTMSATDPAAYTTFDYPSAPSIAFGGTNLTGIDGDTIVGFYYENNPMPVRGQGFVAVLVPEPASAGIFGCGALAVMLRRKKRPR